jgi:hypothetical protein
MTIITYYLQDDSGGGATGQQVSPDFNTSAATTAACLTSAQTIAQMFSTMFQRNVRLVQKYGATIGPPWTPLYTASVATLIIGTAPSGISSP